MFVISRNETTLLKSAILDSNRKWGILLYMGKIKPEQIKESYDVVVAGGGLGGLTAANVLARNGHRVLLAEQHFQLGGLATYFHRGRHIFDVALHGFPAGMKKTLRKYWSKEMADRVVRVRSIRFDNPQFSLDTTFTREDFTDKLVSYFGLDRRVVDAFYDELESMNFYDDITMTNRELFEKYFPGRNDVVRFLMEPITYANGSTLDEPAITYGIVFSNFMSKGVFTFLGGTDLMLTMMMKILSGNNVDFATGTRLERVVLEDGRISGAVLNGKEVGCRSVLSNGNILNTVNDWIDPSVLDREFREKVAGVRLNNSSCQVYLGLKRGEKIGYIGDLLFTSTHPEFDAKSILSKNVSSRTYSVYYPQIRPDSEPDYTIVASMNALYEDWKDLGEREYELSKKRLIEDTLEALEKYVPDIRAKIDHAEAATPTTFRRYTLHGGGASFGTKFEGLEVSMELPEQVPGLYHTGSVGIIMSGWLGVANYGVIVSNNIDRYLSNQH